MNVLTRGKLGKSLYIIRQQLRKRIFDVVEPSQPIETFVLADDDDSFLTDDDETTMIDFEG